MKPLNAIFFSIPLSPIFSFRFTHSPERPVFKHILSFTMQDTKFHTRTKRSTIFTVENWFPIKV